MQAYQIQQDTFENKSNTYTPYQTHYETLNLIKSNNSNVPFVPVAYSPQGDICKLNSKGMLSKIINHHQQQESQHKLMTQITCYNEDLESFKATMKGVLQNCEVMCQDPHINMQLNDYLVVLCIDGIDKIPQAFLEFLVSKNLLNLDLLQKKGYATFDSEINKYKMLPLEDIFPQDKIPQLNNLLHMFSTVIDDDFGIFDEKESQSFRGRNINFICAIKHNNNGKMQTLKWMIEGIAYMINPKYIQKIDIGTRPGHQSTAKLFKHLEAVPNSGGACSEVVIDTDNKEMQNTLEAKFLTMLQYYEYKQTIANFKTFEGWGGFVMSLPGCFCMYRYEALKGEPMERFFKLVNEDKMPTCWDANEYLVEDRLLANVVYYQKNQGYRTDFVIDAPSYTDPCYTIASLMNQRRRWANGFLFGELTTLLNIHNIFGFNGQTHSLLQRFKMILYIPTLALSKAMAWFNPAILLTQAKYFIIYSAMSFFGTEEYKQNYPLVYNYFTNDKSSIGFQSTVNVILIILIMISILASIGAKVQHVLPYFKTVLIIFQIYSLLGVIGTYQAIKNFGFYNEDGSINIFSVQFSLQWVILLCPFYLKPLDMIKNFKKYIIGLPCYYLSYFWWYIICHIYAFCNIDDVSWGNRPSNSSKGLNAIIKDQKRQEEARQQYRVTRTHILIGYLTANIVMMLIFDVLVNSIVNGENEDLKNTCYKILKGYSIYSTILCGIVLLLAMIHTFIGKITPILNSKYKPVKILKKKQQNNKQDSDIIDISPSQKQKNSQGSEDNSSEITNDDDNDRKQIF